MNAMVGILFYLISSGFLVAMSFLDRISLVQDTIDFWQFFLEILSSEQHTIDFCMEEEIC